MADFKEIHKMISHNNELKRYCSEPLENIENYDKAVADTEHVWDCHHRAEILPCGTYTVDQLQKHGLYWHRPAHELIFLRHDAHRSLHRKGKNGMRHSEETKRKMAESNHTKKKVEMTRLPDGFIQTFPSQSEAARWLRLNGYPKASETRVSCCANGHTATAYNAKWRIIHD